MARGRKGGNTLREVGLADGFLKYGQVEESREYAEGGGFRRWVLKYGQVEERREYPDGRGFRRWVQKGGAAGGGRG